MPFPFDSARDCIYSYGNNIIQSRNGRVATAETQGCSFFITVGASEALSLTRIPLHEHQWDPEHALTGLQRQILFHTRYIALGVREGKNRQKNHLLERESVSTTATLYCMALLVLFSFFLSVAPNSSRHRFCGTTTHIWGFPTWTSQISYVSRKKTAKDFCSPFQHIVNGFENLYMEPVNEQSYSSQDRFVNLIFHLISLLASPYSCAFRCPFFRFWCSHDPIKIFSIYSQKLLGIRQKPR